LAKSALNHFYILFQKLDECKARSGKGDKQLAKGLKAFQSAFEKVMDDDFNTAGAIAQLQKLRNQVNRAMTCGLSRKSAAAVKKTFLSYGKILGLLQLNEYEFARPPLKINVADTVTVKDSVDVKTSLDGEMVARLVQERQEARLRNDWARADAIRKQLAEAGITLEDRPDGTTRIRR